jgi:hypothetical protein
VADTNINPDSYSYKPDGFFKAYDNYIAHGPNFVKRKDFELYREEKDSYTLPVDGWYWFDSEEEACNFFGFPYVPYEDRMALGGWELGTVPPGYQFPSN